MTRAAVLYARVSSAEQLREGFSIAAQVKAMRDYAERQGFAIAAEFADDETAKTTGRTDFSKMLAHVRAHPEHAIVVEKVDRLYRNLRDYLTLDELGAEIHFVREGGRDRQDSDARFMHLIRVGMARKYVENLSEEVKKGMRQKCAEGGWPTWAPLGYLNVKESVQKKLTGGIIHDPAKAPLVRDLFEAAATGSYSLGTLASLARQNGLRGRYGAVLSKSAVQYVLTNEAYTGRFTWSGVAYVGKYEPLIERTLFDAVQVILRGGTRSKTRTHTFTYAGLIRCGACDRLLTGDRKKGTYVYYSCRGHNDCKRYYPESLFEERTGEILRSLVVEEAVSDWIVTEMAGWYDRVAAREIDAAARLRRRLGEIGNLTAASYEEKLVGRMDEQTWSTLNERWRAEAGQLTEQVTLLEPSISRADFLSAVKRPFELAQTAADQYVAQNDEQKARLLKIICSNFRVIDGTVYVSMRSPFDVMLDMRGRSDWLGRKDSNLRMAAPKAAALPLGDSPRSYWSV